MDPDNKQSQVPVQTPPIVQTPPPPVQTTPPIQAPPPVIPPETKKSSPLLTIAIASVAVALISVAAYLIGTKFMGQRPVSTPTATPVIIPSPTSTPDVTANWKTHSNRDFSFKYPDSFPNFKVTLISDAGQPLYVIRQTDSSENRIDFSIEIATWENPSQLKLKEWLEYMRTSKALALPVDDFDLTPNTTLGGTEALRFWLDPISKGKEPGKCIQSCPINEVYFVMGNKSYRALFGFSREAVSQDLELIDLTLSTFKFLD